MRLSEPVVDGRVLDNAASKDETIAYTILCNVAIGNFLHMIFSDISRVVLE